MGEAVDSARGSDPPHARAARPRIAEHNQCEGFPKALGKIKLTPEMLDEIFEHFQFKSLTRESTTVNILRHIYNDFFGLIYTTSYEGKNVNYDLVDGVDDFYHFCANQFCREVCLCDKFQLGAFGLCKCGGLKR